MLFVMLGVLLVLLHFLGIGPPAQWNWEVFGDLWKFVLPFLFALAWWGWADSSGYNKRREIEKIDKKKDDRRKQNLEALGMGQDPRQKRKR